MSLPELPKEWHWEVTVTSDEVRVSLMHENVTLVKRVCDCDTPNLWEQKIEYLAELIWSQMHEAGRLGAQLGVWVQYE